MEHHRPELLGLAVSHDGTLSVDGLGEWVCTMRLAEIKVKQMVQGYYRNFLTVEEKAYGEIPLFFPNFYEDNKTVVEAMTTCGERHELPRKALPSQYRLIIKPSEEESAAVKIVQPTDTVAPLHNLPDARAKAADDEQENISGAVPASRLPRCSPVCDAGTGNALLSVMQGQGTPSCL
jgi:hypothetical protein